MQNSAGNLHILLLDVNCMYYVHAVVHNNRHIFPTDDYDESGEYDGSQSQRDHDHRNDSFDNRRGHSVYEDDRYTTLVSMGFPEVL